MTEATSNIRRLSVKKKIIFIISIVFALFQFYTSIFGNLDPHRQRAIHLFFVTILVFIIYPSKKNYQNIWTIILDMILLLFSLIPLGYVIFNYQALLGRMFYVQPLQWYEYMFASMIIISLLEGTRRVIGLGLPLIAFLSLGYAFFGKYIPGTFGHSGFTINEITDQIFYTTEGIFGIPLGASASFVVLFIIFGAFLEMSGISTYIMDLSSKLTLKSRGGPAKMAVIASGLFGSISGSAIANVATTGQVTIPLMKRVGYKPSFAAAVEAVASTGGQIMPPIMGAAVFIMSDFTGIPYITIVKHALLPAILYYVSVYFIVHLEAVRLGLQGADDSNLPNVKQLVKDSYMLVPLVVIVVVLLKGYSPTYACLYSITSVILTSFIKKETRMGVYKISQALVKGVRGTLSVAMACATAGIIVGIVNYCGVGFKFTALMLGIANNSMLLVLVLTAVATIILGMGLPTTPAYVVVAALMVPTLIKLEVPIIAAHLFAYYFANISCITPPVALASYTAAGLADADAMDTGIVAFKLGIAAYIVPFIFVFNTDLLLMDNNTFSLIWTIITSIAGVLLLAASSQGWLLRKATVYERILMFAAALTLIYPGVWTDTIGILLGITAISLQYFKNRVKAFIN